MQKLTMTCNNRINSELYETVQATLDFKRFGDRFYNLETIASLADKQFEVMLTVSYGNRVEYVNLGIYIYITLHEKMDFHQIYSVQIWCKKIAN